MFPEQPLGGLFEVALFDDLKKQFEEASPPLQILVNVMNTTLREKLPLIVNRNGVKCVPLGIGPMYGVGNIEIVLRGLLYRCKNAEQTAFERATVLSNRKIQELEYRRGEYAFWALLQQRHIGCRWVSSTSNFWGSFWWQFFIIKSWRLEFAGWWWLWFNPEVKLPLLKKFYVAHYETVDKDLRTWEYASTLYQPWELKIAATQTEK